MYQPSLKSVGSHMTHTPAQQLARQRTLFLRNIAGICTNLRQLRNEAYRLQVRYFTPDSQTTLIRIDARIAELQSLDDELRAQWSYSPRLTAESINSQSETSNDNITNDN